MRNPILSLAGVFLFGASVPAATLSDHAGLKLALEDNGNIAGVELSGEKLPNGTASGFYLQEPNSPKKVAIVGTAVSKDGKLHWYPDYYRIEPKVMTALGHHHDWINMNYVSETFKTDRQIDPTVKELSLIHI